ncbi:monovalent cation/H+ antiporter complex subunit F [Streptomyces sp. NPDC059853]|uniref:monovalent cation/H+ antiporter complex subunit F n=1 Tax=Streptomyces sp. NPDC059853 TaxID=3346973 RepID=UPI00364765DF
MTVMVSIALGLLCAAALLVTVRLVRGPAALDRIVALDTLVTLIISGTVVGTVIRSDGISGHVLVVLALLGFIGTIAAARLVERREDMR